MRILMILTGLTLIISTCDMIEIEPITDRSREPDHIFTISQGSHYCQQNSMELRELSKLEFTFMFDSSAIYETKDPANQADINKLYGLSDCNDMHHQNSARFGWRWYQDRMEIWAYSYHDGERGYEMIDTVSLSQYYDASIHFEKGFYLFNLNNKTIELPRHCDSLAVGYRLFPYFGGDETAPCQINIYLKEKTEP